MSVKYEDLLETMKGWADAYESLKVLQPGRLYRLDYKRFLLSQGGASAEIWEVIRPRNYTRNGIAYYVLAANRLTATHKGCNSISLLQLRGAAITVLTLKDLPTYVSSPYIGPMFGRVLKGDFKIKEEG